MIEVEIMNIDIYWFNDKGKWEFIIYLIEEFIIN